MADPKPHLEQAQIERARRFRMAIEDLRKGDGVDDQARSKEKSLKEQIQERSRRATTGSTIPGSE